MAGMPFWEISAPTITWFVQPAQRHDFGSVREPTPPTPPPVKARAKFRK
jgi:hypothetical protein